MPGFQIPWTSNFCQIAGSFRADLPPGTDNYLYMWGTPSGRFGGVKLARVLPASIDNLSAYEYYAGLDAQGQPTWISNEYAAPLVVPGTVGEMSVMYNQASMSWTMAYLDAYTVALGLREAPYPWGPWSDSVTITTGAQYPDLCGSYMNPLYVENYGRTIYFTMSMWCPYNVFLVKADLEIKIMIKLPDLTVYPEDLMIPHPPIQWRHRRGLVDITIDRVPGESGETYQATLLARPERGAAFSHWQGNVPEDQMQANPLVMELERDLIVTPVFAETGAPCCPSASLVVPLLCGGAWMLIWSRRQRNT